MIVFGSTDIEKAYLGGAEVSKMYLGDELVFGGDSPIPSEPYDAQVEYLQSSGTQYIDTGIIIERGDIITLTFQAVGTQNAAYFGCRTSESAGKCVIGSGSNSTSIYAAMGKAQNKKLVDFDQNKHTVVLNTVTSRASIDGGSNISVGTYSYNSLNALLFACNQAGTPSLYGTIRIFSFSIEGKANYIPVRKRGVGYMYDTISEELFGNSGTGSFTYGNDVTT